MELMVVAIIVSIMAVVSFPLLNANRRRAWATEAMAGCGAVRTALRIIKNNHGAYPTLADAPVYDSINGIAADEFNGRFFYTTDYRVTSTPSNYTIICTGTAKEVEGRTVILNSDGQWSGTLLE